MVVETAKTAIKYRGRMRLVILESPYAAQTQESLEVHILYARACLRDSLGRGEAPIASHLLYTQPGVLDDNVPVERALGIRAGLSWQYVADLHVFYLDLGFSPGMRAAWESRVIPYEERLIGWKP